MGNICCFKSDSTQIEKEKCNIFYLCSSFNIDESRNEDSESEEQNSQNRPIISNVSSISKIFDNKNSNSNFNSNNSNFCFNEINNSISEDILHLNSLFSISKSYQFSRNLSRSIFSKSNLSKNSNSKIIRKKSKFSRNIYYSDEDNLKNSINSNFNSNFNSNLSINNLDCEFSTAILEEINKARNNPIEFSLKIRELKEKIQQENLTSAKKLFIPYKDFKYELNRGERAFEECINYLEFVDKNMKMVNYNLDPLFLIDELRFPCSFFDMEKLNDQNYIEECLEEIEVNSADKYRIKAFQYFKCVFDLDIFSALHILDDNKNNDNDKLIQKTVFDHTTKYIGINAVKLNEGNYLFLFVYAE